MKDKIIGIIKQALNNMILMQDSSSQASLSTNQIIEEFKHWLLIEAQKDSIKNFRQTRAYEMYLRLSRQFPAKEEEK